MTWTRIADKALEDEARRMALREAVERFNHELLDDEERLLLIDRIKRLRRQLRPLLLPLLFAFLRYLRGGFGVTVRIIVEEHRGKKMYICRWSETGAEMCLESSSL